MKVVVGIMLGFCLFPIALNAQLLDRIKLKKEVDPSLPTNLFTRYDSEFDVQINESTYTVGNIWTFGYAFNDCNFVAANASLAYYERSQAFGIGDIELAYTHLIKLDTLAFVNAAGFKLQALLPTGNYEKFMGLGSVRVMPTFFATLKLSPKFYVLPEAGYLYTSKTVSETMTQPNNADMHGYFVSTKFIYKLNLNTYLWVTPMLGSERFADEPEVSLEVVYGAKILNRFGLTFIVRPNFTTRAMEFKVGNSIFF
jgi:hypothetical protein